MKLSKKQKSFVVFYFIFGIYIQLGTFSQKEKKIKPHIFKHTNNSYFDVTPKNHWLKIA